MWRPATRRNGPRRGIVIVDSSAVVAILFGEPSAASSLAGLAAHPVRLMPVVNYAATGTVLAGRRRSDRAEAISDLDAFLDEAGIGLVPVDAAQARIALDARIHYGRGMGHGRVLN
jgi:ribonuclease VapC